MDSVEKFKNQHFLSYKNAVSEIINNNTEVLYDEDIKSLFKKPPLDSMDLLKTKIISLAKKKKSIINIEKLEDYLEKYRNHIYKLLNELKSDRNKLLLGIIDNYDITKTKVFKFNKKDFVEYDKLSRKKLQICITESFSEYLLKNVNLLFTNNDDSNLDINEELSKYFSNYYIKQILENFDFKILVKNTILINSLKEQGERYNFTLDNSHLFNE